MPIKTPELEEPQLILTPMVDIVMLIMIFFMVSTEFRRMETQYEIQLPKVTEAQPLTAMPDEIVVNIQSDGAIHVGSELRTLDQLELDLVAARGRYADQMVVIRGDGTGPYQHIMTVLNICKRARISNIQLANRVEARGGP